MKSLFLFSRLVLFIAICACDDDGVKNILNLKNAVLKERTRQVELAREQCSTEPQRTGSANRFLNLLDDEVLTRNDVFINSRSRRSAKDVRKAIVLAKHHKGVMLLSKGSEGKESEELSLGDIEEFTLDLWVNPEGGQENRADIIRSYDRCSPFSEGWLLGIEADEDGEKDAHYYAKINVANTNFQSILRSPTRLKSNKWTHVALTYDGMQSSLYVNGARVNVNRDQRGPVFRSKERVGFLKSCRVLQLGRGFRGALTNLRLWRRALNQNELQTGNVPNSSSDLTFRDTFETDENWEWESGQSSPSIVANVIESQSYGLTPEKPDCGLTICDSPQVVLSYADNWQLRAPKTIRYQVVNVRNSDGSNATVHPAQIAAQHKALKAVFRPYNITWELSELNILNSSLRRRTILFGCLPQQVGDGVCNHECSRQLITRNDGGDCDRVRTECDLEIKVGNGQCDPECNLAYHGWDGGDCCNPDITDTTFTCVDPSSAERAFLDVEELKSLLKLPSDEQLNIFFAHRTNQDIAGLATFPWEKQVFTELGGIVIRPEDFGVEGRTDTLIHEIGHALGLWHVHKGISETGCGDACFESLPSMTEGDLCEDTRPTIAHSGCRDPAEHRHRCGVGPFKATPYHNYMSYADDACTNHFTEQQVARMHCYIDLAYPSWVDQHVQNFRPPSPPLAPTVVDYVDGQLTLAWVAPLNEQLYLNDDGSCSKCSGELSLVQYGTSARGSASPFAEAWQPHQATGPPDAETCFPSPKSWMPDPKYCGSGLAETNSEGCTLHVTFAVPVIPHSMSIWLSWHARQGLADVTLHFADGTSESLGSVATTCDQKYTVLLSQLLPWLSDSGDEKSVTKVTLRTANALVAVDSVQIVSRPNHQDCYKCKPLKYRVYREPGFLESHHRVFPYYETEDLEFTDKFIVEGNIYKYTVEATFGNQLSYPSPAVVFRSGQLYCGDNQVQKPREQCDDGNQLNGDGCDNRCQLEKGFHCTGSPSLCYLHRGDGLCEYFEKDTVVEDCGYSTPTGFEDQWASKVTNYEHQGPSCPLEVILGPPNASIYRGCSKEADPSNSWKPCVLNSEEFDDFYFEAFFPKTVVASAVVLYLSWDGRMPLSNEEFKRNEDDEGYQFASEPSVSIDLIDSDGRLNPIGSSKISCTANPVTIPVVHDLTKPFHLTNGVRVSFTSPETSFSAVRLRSIKHFNPLEVQRCSGTSGRSMLYNPDLDQCVSYPGCRRPICEESPLIKNGRLVCSGKEEGDSCTVLCDEGYLQNGIDKEVNKQAILTCNGGHWIGMDLSCRPIDCYQPKIPHADSVCPEGTTLGRNCTFKCRPPARMRPVGVINGNGNGGATAMVTCNKDGTWAESETYCLLTCPSPVTPDHSVMVDHNSGKQKYFGFGQTCKFRCKVGYHVAGKSIRSRQLQLQCNSSGIWSGPVCIPITCGELDTSDGGVLDCSDSNRAGSVCTKTCPPAKFKKRKRKDSENEYRSESDSKDIETSRFSTRCGMDGQWEQTLKMCSPQADGCPQPRLNDPAVKYECSNSNVSLPLKVVGSVCKISCVQLEYEPILVVQSDGRTDLTVLTTGTSICTGQGRWLPDPSNVQCFPKCNKGYIGDGYCDAANNQAQCSWDGGDCCESTVKGHKVKPFPDTCVEACRCLDPYA